MYLTCSLVTIFCVCSLAASLEALFVSVDPSHSLSEELPGDFASFSLETHCVVPFFSDNSTSFSPRRSFTNLLNFLRNASGSNVGPNVRIGGDSADQSYFVGDNSSTPLPIGDKFQITSDDIATYAAVWVWNGTLTIDVNLRNPADPTNSIQYALAAVERVGRRPFINGIEIGNEPDIFTGNGIRPRSFTFAEYQSEFEIYARALVAQTNLTKMPAIQGGTTCCGKFDGNLDGYIKKFTTAPTNFLSSFSYHHYPLDVCNRHNVTINDLLQLDAARSVTKLAGFARICKQQGIPFFIGEGNSVACGGAEGVSNTFASTLWSIDTLFFAATSQMSRWNFHGCIGSGRAHGAYDPIAFVQQNTTSSPAGADADGSYASPRPLFYGMWAFSEAIANSGRVVESEVINTTNPMVRLWATKTDRAGPSQRCHRLTIVVLHKGSQSESDENGSAHVSVHIKAKEYFNQMGQLRVLEPSSGQMNATDGVSFGNVTFDGSKDGVPIGTRVGTPVKVSSDGCLEFHIAPTSAVLVTVSLPCSAIS